MRLSSSYTPQAVVNGTREFVGSNRAALYSAIERASDRKPVDLALTVRRENNSLIATIRGTAPAGDDLMIAVTEDNITTKIQHGENAGRTLTNDAIVRRLVRAERGETRVSIDPAWQKLAVAAFFQNRNTLAVAGCVRVQVNQ
jgi:hypothetical protein